MSMSKVDKSNWKGVEWGVYIGMIMGFIALVAVVVMQALRVLHGYFPVVPAMGYQDTLIVYVAVKIVFGKGVV